MKFIFDTHGSDRRLNHRSGQTVKVVRALTEKEADIEDVGKMFHVRFADGFETDAFADELTLDSLDETDSACQQVPQEIQPWEAKQYVGKPVWMTWVEDPDWGEGKPHWVVISRCKEEGVYLTEGLCLRYDKFGVRWRLFTGEVR